MATADQAVAVFDSFLGITESPPHSNMTPIGAEFGWNGVPWCCESCSVVLKRAFGRVILWTASVAQAVSDAGAGKNGMRLLNRDATITAGDLVTYDWTGRGDPSEFHIEMVRDPGTQARFQTDGGNAGDACRQQWRDRIFVSHFIRPPYDNLPSIAPTAPKEEDMAEPGPAVDAWMDKDGTGYELDRYGGIHPVGGRAVPDPIGDHWWPGQDVARHIIIVDASKNAGYVQDCKGGMHEFGGAPKVSDAPYWP